MVTTMVAAVAAVTTVRNHTFQIRIRAPQGPGAQVGLREKHEPRDTGGVMAFGAAGGAAATFVSTTVRWTTGGAGGAGINESLNIKNPTPPPTARMMMAPIVARLICRPRPLGAFSAPEAARRCVSKPASDWRSSFSFSAFCKAL